MAMRSTRSCQGRLVRWLVAWLCIMLLHTGEAANPGPETPSWYLGSFNPTGLNGKQQILNEHLSYGDIWAVSETHLSSRSMYSFKKGLRCSESPYKFCVGGHPSPLRPRSEHVGSWSGVAVLSKHPTRAVPIQFQEDLYKSSRIQMATSLCHDLWITGVCLYGEPVGQSHPFAQENTEWLVQAAVDAVSSVPGLRYVAGDFNFQPQTLQAFRRLENLGFRDIQTVAEERWGILPRCTCKGSTRKDYIFLSPELQSLLTETCVIDDVWADHSVLVGKFVGQPCNISRQIWRMPRQFQWPPGFHLQDVSLEVNFETHNPTEQYALMWQQVEQQATALNEQRHVPIQKSQCGRGQTLETTTCHGTSVPRLLKPSRQGDVLPHITVASIQHARWFRQLRRLQAYARFRKKNDHDNHEAHGAALWHSILHAKGFDLGFVHWWQHSCTTQFPGTPMECPLIPPSSGIAEMMFESFAQEVRALESKLNRERRAMAIKSRESNAYQIFQDVKRSPPERLDLLIKAPRSKVVSIDPEALSIVIDPPVTFSVDIPCVVQNQPREIFHAESDILFVDDVTGVNQGDVIIQPSFLGKESDLFEAFAQEWRKRWDRHSKVLPSQWDQILQFSKNHLRASPCSYELITPQVLQAELKNRKKRSATGPDGVSLLDYLSMPTSVLKAHCDMYRRAEQSGSWPQQVLIGRVASLAKVDSPTEIGQYRPITVLPLSYRAWGSIRAKQLLRHLDQQCPAWLLGNRPGAEAKQLWVFVQWQLELAYLEQKTLSGISADVVKAFNHIPREVMFQACLLLGLPHRILTGWAGALTDLQRRFQIRDSTGPPIFSTTGLPEGDALSCVGMQVVDILFHKWFESQHTMSKPMSYVDDWQILTEEADDIPALLISLNSFVNSIDLQLDSKKTYLWSTCAAARKRFKSHGIPVREDARTLGAQMQFTRKHRARVLHARLRELSDMWSKLRASPSPYHLKAKVLRAAAWPKGFHGIAALSLGQSWFQQARSGAMKGIEASGAGCNPMVHLGLVEPPLTDPQFWAVFDHIRTFRSCHTALALQPLLHDALQDTPRIPKGGPTMSFLDRLSTLGWQLQEDAKIIDSLGCFSLFESSLNEIMLRATLAWTQVVASSVRSRQCFQGLHRANGARTRQFVASLSKVDQGIFRKSLNGACYTNDALCYFTPSGSSVCNYCGKPDSRMHRYWNCEVFQSARAHCDQAVLQQINDLPPCLTQCGWTLHSDTQEHWWSYLSALEVGNAIPPDFQAFDPGQWFDVFTDGSCMWPQTWEYRYASWSVCLASPSLDVDSSVVLHAGPLPGILQSAYRAELFGILQAIRWGRQHSIKVRLWCDCLGVVERVRKLLLDPLAIKVNSPNFDLWRQVRDEISRLGTDRICITKVAAHQQDMNATDAVERWAFIHNALADRAARLANVTRPQSFWQLLNAHVRSVDQVHYVCQQVQTTILNISRQVVNGGVLSHPYTEQVELNVDKVPHHPVETPTDFDIQLPTPLPINVTSKFGFRVTAIFAAWLKQALGDVDEMNRNPRWVSFAQLYLDFQHCTGEYGPVYEQGWIDVAKRPCFRMRQYPFKKRCAWFTRFFKHVLALCGQSFRVEVTRPHSINLQLHLPSVWIIWPESRLDFIEAWLSTHLTKAATRGGSILQGLPLAKRDGRWPNLVVEAQPLCM